MKRKLIALSIAVGGSLVFAAGLQAQDTNLWPVLPRTVLEAFNTNVSTVVIRATEDIGTISANRGTLVVRCRQVTDAGTGQREYGLVIELTAENVLRDTRLVDYEELAPLLRAMDFLREVDWSITSLTSFDAGYNTKGGLRLVAFNSRRTNVMGFAVRGTPDGTMPVQLSPDQFLQLRGMIDQGREKLDSLRRARDCPPYLRGWCNSRLRDDFK
jgi:hypothetical protein